MEHGTDEHHDGLFTAIKAFGWLIVAALVAGAAGYGAYYRLGGIDTPMQKAGVVGAALLGFGAAAWLNKIARIVIYGLIVVLLIWGGNYWWHHR